MLLNTRGRIRVVSKNQERLDAFVIGLEWASDLVRVLDDGPGWALIKDERSMGPAELRYLGEYCLDPMRLATHDESLTEQEKKDEDMQALLLSAEKWLLTWQGKKNDQGRVDCACCELTFQRTGQRASCCGCPIAEHTGFQACRGTPYWAVVLHTGARASTSKQKEAAEAEYRFLVDLFLKLADEGGEK